MKKMKNSYRKSGVNISLANKFVKHISVISKKVVQKRKIHFKKKISVVLDLYLILVIIK